MHRYERLYMFIFFSRYKQDMFMPISAHKKSLICSDSAQDITSYICIRQYNCADVHRYERLYIFTFFSRFKQDMFMSISAHIRLHQRARGFEAYIGLCIVQIYGSDFSGLVRSVHIRISDMSLI